MLIECRSRRNEGYQSYLPVDAFTKHNLHCVQFDRNNNSNSLFSSVDNQDILFFNRILNDAVYNFPNNQEEITLCVCPETFKVKNYVDDEPGKKWKHVIICTWLVVT